MHKEKKEEKERREKKGTERTALARSSLLACGVRSHTITWPLPQPPASKKGFVGQNLKENISSGAVKII